MHPPRLLTAKFSELLTLCDLAMICGATRITTLCGSFFIRIIEHECNDYQSMRQQSKDGDCFQLINLNNFIKTLGPDR